MEKTLMKKTLVKKSTMRKILNFALRFAIAFLFLSPFFLAISYSFRTDTEIMMTKGITLLPRQWTLENYGWVFEYMPFFTYLKNSMIHYVLIMAAQIVFCSLTAFAFSFYEFKGKKLLFNAILVSMMIPGEVTIITNFLQVQSWGLSNTYLGMVIISLVSSLAIFNIRQFYLSLPKEFKEASTIDGCTDLGFFFRIALPLSVPTLSSLCIYEFVTIYNRYLWPLLIAQKDSMFTIQIGMDMLKSAESDNLGIVLAGAVMCILPVVVVFSVGQKYIIRGMVSGGVKG